MGRRVIGAKGNGRDSWLIKSSGRILGPFDGPAVQEKLKTREIVPLDEIIAPLGRWHYVIDEPAFAEVARKMKDQEVENERTMTSTLEANAQDDLTDTVDIHSGKTPPPNLNAKGTATKVKTYGFQRDKNLHREALTRSRMGLIVAAVALIVVVGSALYNELAHREGGGAAALIRQGKTALEFNEFDRARDFLIRALKKDKRNSEAIMALVPIAAQIDGDFFEANDLLRDLVDMQMKTSEVFALQGLVYLLERKHYDAEQALDSSLGMNRRFVPSIINKMALLWQLKRYPEVLELYAELEKLNAVDGPSTMLVVNTYIDQYHQIRGVESNPGIELPGRALKLIDQYLAKNMAYRQEFLLAKNYIEFVLLRQGKLVNLLAVLNMDPLLTEKHYFDLGIFQSHLQWGALFSWCQEIRQASGNSAYSEALNALCLMKTKGNFDAKSAIDHAIKKNPKDHLLTALRAFYQIQTHEEDKGVKLLQHVARTEPNDLVLFLLGHYCPASEPECSVNAWRVLMARDPRHPAALHGMARYAWTKGDKQEARNYMKKGFEVSPGYVPLKKLQWQIERGSEE